MTDILLGSGPRSLAAAATHNGDGEKVILHGWVLSLKHAGNNPDAEHSRLSFVRSPHPK